MTVIAHHVSPHRSSVRNSAHRSDRPGQGSAETGDVARRDADATRRRQEALARLAQRRMPLPALPQSGRTDVIERSRRESPVGGHMSLVTSITSQGGGPRCTCTMRGHDLPRPALTTREVEVLRTWLKVDTKPAVAAELYISLGTVNTHLTRIRAKYADIGRAAPTKAALVARAVQDGLITLDEL